jgi:SHS2 domain-containing protein
MIEVVEHTADIRLRISGASIEELFRDALRGTMQLLRPDLDERSVQREIAVEAADRTTLLIDFLNEALSHAHVHREAYDDAVFTTLTETRVVAQLHGREARAFGDDVKAVTYHEAEIRQPRPAEAGPHIWSVTIVYDI